MYISEHVAYIRHRSTTVGCAYIYKLSLVSTFLFLFFFFSTMMRNERIHRKQRTKGQSSGQLVRPWFICIVVLNVIVVYCRQKFVVLCLIFIDHILIYIKKPTRKINLVNFTHIYIHIYLYLYFKKENTI